MASNMSNITFDAAAEQLKAELSRAHGKRGAASELAALVDAALAQRNNKRSAADLAAEFGVSTHLVEAVQRA